MASDVTSCDMSLHHPKEEKGKSNQEK